MLHLCFRFATGALLAAAMLAAPAPAQLPFFPGAEGYGGAWSGAEPAGGWLSNATVYHVTNLNDSGAGSLRGAFAENTANKIIVFDVAGVINLTSDNLDIKNLANYYIAGQTAPGPVTVYGDMVQLTHSGGKENRNVVLRYMSFRKGTGNNSDSITFAGSGLGTNMILDHVSASWSEDEVLSVANNNTNVTVQYTTIHDALVSNHAYGSLIRPRIDSNVSFHHNLYAHNASRQARFGTYNAETLTADFRNNVVYNFRDRASYAGGSSEDEREFADVNYVGNYIIAGPGTTGSATRAFSVDQNMDARVYQSGNFIDSDKTANPGGVPNGANTGWGMFGMGGLGSPVQTLTQMATPFATPAVTTQTATDAYGQVINHVGNSWWNRGPIDTRVINNVLNFTGPAIGAAAPNAAELSALLATPMILRPGGWDTDNDGMPDAWEIKHGMNPASPVNTPDWKLDFDNDGYINLIDYVNEAGEFPAPAPIVFNGAASNRYAQITNWRTSDGVTAGSNWQPSKYDDAVVHSGVAVIDAVGQHAAVLHVAPTAGDAATLNVTGGWLEVTETLGVGSLGAGTVNHNGGLVVANTVILGGGLDGMGAYNLSGTGALDTHALATAGLGGSFNFTGGALTAWLINFDIVNQGGVFSPSGPQRTAEVVGDFTNSAGTIQMDLTGAGPGQFDRMIIHDQLAAGGVLDVNLLGGFMPANGASFDLFDFASASGAFTLDLPALPGGLVWKTNSLLTTGVLSVGLPGYDADFDGDGNIDGTDFLTWQRGLGLAGQTDKAAGDANGDHVVDELDLSEWMGQYGATGAATAAGGAVPEPAAGLLALAAAFTVGVVRRQSRA